MQYFRLGEEDLDDMRFMGVWKMEDADVERQKSDVSEPIAPFSIAAVCFQNSVHGPFPDEGRFDER